MSDPQVGKLDAFNLPRGGQLVTLGMRLLAQTFAACNRRPDVIGHDIYAPHIRRATQTLTYLLPKQSSV